MVTGTPPCLFQPQGSRGWGWRLGGRAVGGCFICRKCIPNCSTRHVRGPCGEPTQARQLVWALSVPNKLQLLLLGHHLTGHLNAITIIITITTITIMSICVGGSEDQCPCQIQCSPTSPQRRA